MKFLFIHNNFPGQFIHLANALVCQGHNVVFLSNYKRGDIEIKGIRLITIPPVLIGNEGIQSNSHRVSQELFFTSETFAAALLKLRNDNFFPDIVIAHPGWGACAYIKDIFPNSGYIIYCEWYYNKGELHNFFSHKDERPSAFAPNRHRNFYQVNALLDCDAALCPTYWQHSQYPKELSSKIRIIHDGIDTDFFSPGDEDPILDGIDLSEYTEIVTYATRGMEPYRGFPQFYKSIPYILSERPNCHIFIMADDKTCYSAKRSDGKTWLQVMMEEVPEAKSENVHFMRYGNYKNYRKLLRFSSVHVYLTVPFVLSWSLLEAMSCGCLIVASDTTPVREVLKNNYNGLFTSFNDSITIANSIKYALSNVADLTHLRAQARKDIVEKYNKKITLPAQLQLIREIMLNKNILKKGGEYIHPPLTSL